MLDNLNHLDTDGVEQGNRISIPKVKRGSDHTANNCTNLEDAIHIVDLAQTFDGSLQCTAMGFDKVKLALIFCNLLSHVTGINFPNIALLNKAQNGNGICFVTQRVKIGLWKLQLRRAEATFFEI
jgi:hypothetical protein